MFASIAFYIGEKVLGLNDREYPLGELTAEALNISPEEYHELRRMLDKAMESMDRYEENHQMQDWFDANEKMIRLHEALIQHRIFRLIQDKPEVLYEARTLTEQYTLFPEDGDTLAPGERDLSILGAIMDYENYLEHPKDYGGEEILTLQWGEERYIMSEPRPPIPPAPPDKGPKDGSGAPAQAVSWQRTATLEGGVPVVEPSQTGSGERKRLPALSGMVGIQNSQR